MSTPEDLYPWLPIEAVLDHLGNASASHNLDAVERARRAAASYCERNRRDLALAGGFMGGAAPYDDAIVEAGILGAARLYARKGSPTGRDVASYSEYSTSILSYDPDVERLLGIGRYAAPGVG